MTAYASFSPALIVEVTAVCDRHCAGCYAPNVLSKADPAELYQSSPELFLTPVKLENQLTEMGSLHGIALRGGEPSKHWELTKLLEICHHHSDHVYLETHGRWISDVSPAFADTSFVDRIAVACTRLGTTIKLSFDRMHGLSSQDLHEITDRLNARSIRWLVAITELSWEEFLTARVLCPWIPDEQILFQPKAVNVSGLYRPSRGVIRVDGRLTSSLKILPKFEEPLLEARP